MAEEVTLGIKLDAGNAPKTLGGLKKSIEDLNQELEQVPIGSKAFKELSAELTEANREVKNLELNMEALDTEQQASELGSVAGAVGDITSAFVLLGGESDTMEQIAESIQTALGVSMAFKGAIEGVASARKLLNSLDKQSTIIKAKDLVVSKARRVAEIAMMATTKAATIAQRAFNLVLNANPILLIVTGIGLLITGVIALIKNFDKVTEAAKEFGKWLLFLIDPFGLIIDQTEELQSAEEKAADSRKKQSKELSEQTAKRLKEIDETREKEAKAHAGRLTEYQLQISRLEATGKSSFEVRLAMLEDINAEKKAMLQANQDKLQSWIDYYTTLAEIRGQDTETFKASLKTQGVDLDTLQNQFLESQKGLEQAIFQSETDILALKRKRSEQGKAIRDKETAEKQKEIDKQKAIDEKAVADELKLKEDLQKAIDKIEEDYRISFLSDQEKEVDAVRLKYEKLIEEAQQYGLDTAMVEEARLEELANIRAEYALKEQEAALIKDEEKKSKDLAEREEEIAAMQAQTESVINNAQQIVDIVSKIQSIGNKREIERIKAKQEAGEQLSKQEANRLKRDAALRKAFAVAQVAIDTAQSISSAIAGATAAAAATGPGAVVATPIFIATQLATVLGALAQTASILGAPTPSVSVSGSGSNPEFEDPTEDDPREDAPNTDIFNTGSTLLNQKPQQVYVLEQDISDSQDSVANIKQQASFG